MELLETLSYEGMTTSQIKEKIDLPKSTLYDNLKKLVEEGRIIKDGPLYRKLREVPTVDVLLDALQQYHGQRLMDWKYRKKDKSEQYDICLQWLIDGPTIKGIMEEYDMEKLLNNINRAYNIFTA